MTVRLKCLSPRPMASLRLLCIPFAGAGAAAFRGWAELLPPHVEAFAVQLPGREDRLAETPHMAWNDMFAGLRDAIAALHPQRTALFGHSLGAVVAFELARWMQATGAATLERLFVSARPWPGHPVAPLSPIWSADDDGLVAAMDRRFGSLATSLSHPEIRDVVLSALRADLRLLDDHRYAGGPPLRCPLTVFAAASDPTTDGEALTGWQRETAAAFDLERFDGGHFFIESHRRELVAAIAARLPAPSRW